MRKISKKNILKKIFKPKHKKKKVEIFGLKFRDLSELHETLGIFFKDKNIF